MKSATSLFSILAVPAPANGRAATTFLNKLLLPGLSILLAYFCVSAHAQSGQWTWAVSYTHLEVYAQITIQKIH